MKEEVVINGIYKHKSGNLYRVEQIAHHCALSAPVVIYHRCDERGLFLSIRENAGTPNEKIVKQPFYRDLEDFISTASTGEKRFTLIKTL